MCGGIVRNAGNSDAAGRPAKLRIDEHDEVHCGNALRELGGELMADEDVHMLSRCWRKRGCDRRTHAVIAAQRVAIGDDEHSGTHFGHVITLSDRTAIRV